MNYGIKTASSFFETIKQYFWTASSHQNGKISVRNRIPEIQGIISKQKWCHVTSLSSPDDQVTLYFQFSDFSFLTNPTVFSPNPKWKHLVPL